VSFDFKLWLDFVKSVDKLSKPNLHKKYQLPKSLSFNINKEFNCARVLSRLDEKRKVWNLSTGQLNKKERRKFRSQAIIDFHGYNRNIEHALELFCLKCIANNIKSITVIGGKGAGILKNAIKNWIDSNPKIVYGYFEIKDTTGQSGAFGVVLRSR
jgi:DNA-nicking Smr family endonuclease